MKYIYILLISITGISLFANEASVTNNTRNSIVIRYMDQWPTQKTLAPREVFNIKNIQNTVVLQVRYATTQNNAWDGLNLNQYDTQNNNLTIIISPEAGNTFRFQVMRSIGTNPTTA